MSYYTMLYMFFYDALTSTDLLWWWWMKAFLIYLNLVWSHFIADKTEKCKCPSHLHKDSEEDDGDDGGEEHVLPLVVGQQEPQREGDGTSQATVGHDELILFGQLHDTEFINNAREANDSWRMDRKQHNNVCEEE